MFFILIGFKYILNRCFVLTGLDTLNIDKNDLDPVSLLMDLPIQKKYGCTCHFNIASPTGTPQEQNSLYKIRLHNWKPKEKKHRFQRKVGGFIVAGSVFLFFVFFGCFFLFSVFVFFWWFCLLYRLSIGVVLPWTCFLHCCRSLLPYSAIVFH